MIRICVSESERRLVNFSVLGHGEHDVCVSVSALVSAFVQYSKDFSHYRCGCLLDLKSYDRGNVSFILRFDSEKSKNEYLYGTQGLMTGLELFAETFPKEISLTVCRDVTHLKEEL